MQVAVRPLLALSACLLAFVVVGCSQADPSLAKATTVVFVGDSLAQETAPFLGPLLGERTLAAYVAAGTAVCDFVATDLGLTNETLLVVSFTGNSLTTCMEDGAGVFLSGPALLDKYRADTAALVKAARAAGANVLLVGQPVRSDAWPPELVDGMNAIYKDLADARGVVFTDAGAAVENPDGTFAAELPCLPNEVECGTAGTNVVRTDDGVHLCPGALIVGPCAGYASGAFRFAQAIADAIINS